MPIILQECTQKLGDIVLKYTQFFKNKWKNYMEKKKKNYLKQIDQKEIKNKQKLKKIKENLSILILQDSLLIKLKGFIIFYKGDRKSVV